MVDQRVGPVVVLSHVGHADPGERRDLLGLTSHGELRADEVDVEGGPDGGADQCLHRDPGPGGAVAHWSCRAQFEGEPVTEVGGRGLAQFAQGDVDAHIAIEVDVDRAAHAEVAREQRRRPLDDPAAVDEVEPGEQAVVGDLPLELGQLPSAS